MYVLPGHSCHAYIVEETTTSTYLVARIPGLAWEKRYTKPPLTQSCKNQTNFRQVEFPYKQMPKIEAFWPCIDHMEPFENTAKLWLIRFFSSFDTDRKSWPVPIDFYGPKLALIWFQNWPLSNTWNLTGQLRRNMAVLCSEAYQEWKGAPVRGLSRHF